jgi:sulfide:quinone oxidoreductase
VAKEQAMSDSPAFKVLIAGGGCAALEAAFRLQHIGGNKIDTTVLAPDRYFATVAFAVLAPFAAGDVPHEPLADLVSAAGARPRRGRLASVAPDDHRVLTEEGETIDYDALLIAVGAVKHAPYAHVLAFGSPGAEELMHGLVQDLEAGYVRSIAFVVPDGTSWPVPLYELALMTADRAYDMGQNPALTLVTPEQAPLALFGPETSRALAARLARAGVTVITGGHADVPRAGLVELPNGADPLSVDRVVTLPEFHGPNIQGIPADARGFVPVDRHGRVAGVSDVYAAGDATSAPIKQGGLACQQADAAAETIAARAGAALEPQPYRALLQGVLLTEHGATVLRRTGDTAGHDAGASTKPLWWPPTKIAGKELTRHIRDLPRHRAPAEGEGVEIRLQVPGP